MAKRFIDTDLFRKGLVRGLSTPYKALWVYLLCECDHAGVWDVEMDVASMRLGVKLDPAKCLTALGGAVVQIDGGRKWWLPEFVAFQYGHLNPANKVHGSVLAILSKFGIDPLKEGASEDHTSPLQGAKDMDKEKAMDKEGEGVQGKPGPVVLQIAFASEKFALTWAEFVLMRIRIKEPMTPYAETLMMAKCLKLGEADAIQRMEKSIANNWKDITWPGEKVGAAAEARKATESNNHAPVTLGQRSNAVNQ